MNKNFVLFKTIIRESNYDNTYKMAWAKSLVELSTELNLIDDELVITLEMIAKKYIKYYWNQTIFFDLIQGSNLLRPPVVVSIVKELIEEYFKFKKSRIPILFEKVEIELENDELKYKYYNSINRVISVLKADVSWRFTFLNRKFHDEIYRYKKYDNELYISKDLMNCFKENEQDLYDLINYRWALILETFNSSPRINKKVKIMDERTIKRKSLDKFKEYLNYENPKHICFYCGKLIQENDLSIDHVIPWSYMYSDDIWNLVFVCKSCNSSKNNKIPSEIDVKKLKERNSTLEELVKENQLTGKVVDELLLANDKDYVTKFWIGSKN